MLSSLRTQYSFHDFLNKEEFWKEESNIARSQMKSLLEQEFSGNQACLSIIKEKEGKPWGIIFENNYYKKIGVSTSHSYPFVFSIAHQENSLVGCDVEKIREFREDFLQSFLRKEELILLRGYQGDVAILATTLWAIKESFFKALGTGLRVDPRELNISNIIRSNFGHQKTTLYLKGNALSAQIPYYKVFKGFVFVALVLDSQEGDLL